MLWWCRDLVDALWRGGDRSSSSAAAEASSAGTGVAVGRAVAPGVGGDPDGDGTLAGGAVGEVAADGVGDEDGVGTADGVGLLTGKAGSNVPVQVPSWSAAASVIVHAALWIVIATGDGVTVAGGPVDAGALAEGVAIGDGVGVDAEVAVAVALALALAVGVGVVTAEALGATWPELWISRSACKADDCPSAVSPFCDPQLYA